MTGDAPRLVEVAVALPLPTTYHYRVPDSLDGQVGRGARVLVPFGPRRITGYVLGFPASSEVPATKLRDVLDLLDATPLLPPLLLDLIVYAARYYAQPPGELLRAALPAGINLTGRRTVRRLPPSARPTDPDVASPAGHAPSAARAAVRRALFAQLDEQPRPCDEVLREAGQGARTEDLLALQRAGLVELEFDLPRPRVRVRKVKLLSWCRAPRPEERLGTRQQELMALLAVRRQMTVTELRQALPDAAPVVRSLAAKGLLREEEIEELRDPFVRDPVVPDQPPLLTAGQQAVLAELRQAFEHGGFAPFLLDGETGSGKTEVYLAAISLARQAGRSALVLVPEISLTPQLAGRFRARFGDRAVAVLHSGLSEGERYDQWRRIRSGEVTIVVGARSAVFAPLTDVGVIVVDEEHDPSYHQDESPRYDGRSLALLRAQREGALIVLGSATPSLETHHLAMQGRYRRVELRGRPTGGTLPEVELVDLRRTPLPAGGVPFSERLVSALRQTVAAGEQAILFLNRRGFAPVVLCRACGEAVACPNCSVSLTYHRQDARLRCHYCDHGEGVPARCPACQGGPLLQLGLGTEKIEAAVQQLLPDARVARLDRDTVGKRGLEALLRAVREREIDVLVGTQMVAKGHDFPGVTLVGVILADSGLRLPDFRAAERTFQLLAQVAGRAGRREQPGRVIIQTYSPEHYALRSAQHHDFAAFSRSELALRRQLGFPPFTHLIALHFEGEDGPGLRRLAGELGQELEQQLTRPGAPPVSLLGPAPAPLELLRGRHRWQLLLKAPRRADLRSLLPRLQAWCAQAERSGLRTALDVDPISLM